MLRSSTHGWETGRQFRHDMLGRAQTALDSMHAYCCTSP